MALKISLNPVYKSILSKWSIIAVLLTWNMVLSIKLLAVKPLLIGIDSDGTRVISSIEDPLLRSEKVAFIKRFIENFYQYNAENFDKRMAISTDMMSEELWNKKLKDLSELRTKLQNDPISTEVLIKKINKHETEGTYYAHIGITITHRLDRKTIQMLLTISVKDRQRSTKNPWGMEVNEIEEKELY